MTFASSLEFTGTFLLCTEKSESIGWQDSVSRQRTGDCSEMHPPHWQHCDLLFSSHQSFLHKVPPHQCVFCKGPLSFWSASIHRNFVFLGSEKRYYVSLIFDATFVRRSESGSWEICAGTRTSESSTLSVNSSNHSGISRKRSSETRLSFFLFFCLGFSILPRSSFLKPDRHVALRLDLMRTGPSMSMLKTNWPGLTIGTKLSVLHLNFFPCLVNRGFWPLTHS